MYLRQFNNKATRGQYELNSVQFQSIFPETSRFLIDYVLDRSYLNEKDPRVMRSGIISRTVHLNALSVLRDTDQFDAHDGEMLTKLKLFDKATRFLDGFRHQLNEECGRMEHRIQFYPGTVIEKSMIDPLEPFHQSVALDYLITDNYSYAKLNIPVAMSCVNNPTIEWICTNIADYACEALRCRKNIDFAINVSIQRFMEDFANDIIETFVTRCKRFGGGNWFIEKDCRGRMKSIAISVHTRKSSDDEHDPEKAAKELIKRLNRSYRKLEQFICLIAIDILHKSINVGRISRVTKSATAARQYCVDKGLVKTDDYSFKALDNLLKPSVE